jgi:DNA polymerase III epsilon subunit-like protein
MGRLIKGPWAFTADEQNLVLPSDDLEYVAFDVETTGFNKNDRIVKIGLVTFKNGQLLEERKESKCQRYLCLNQLESTPLRLMITELR